MSLKPTPPNSGTVAHHRPTPGTIVSAGHSKKGGHSVFQSLSYTPLPPKNQLAITEKKDYRNFSITKHKRQQEQAKMSALSMDTHSIRCAIRVSCAWRGFFVRKQLRALRLYEEMKTGKVIKIQCWARCAHAKVRVRKLRSAKADAVVQRRTTYSDKQLREIQPRMQWQRNSMENAAVKIQRVFRWYLVCRRLEASARECPEFPLPRRAFTSRRPAAGSPNRSGSPDAPAQDDTSVRQYAGQVVPWTPRVVLWEHGNVSENQVTEHNALMRQREARKRHESEHTYALVRRETNQQAVVDMDLDACAAIIQRRWKCHSAEFNTSSRKITKGYFDKYAQSIQHCYRRYIAARHVGNARKKKEKQYQMRRDVYEAKQLEEIAEIITWSKYTVSRAAIIVQRVWRAHCEGKSKHDMGPYGMLAGTRSPGRYGRKKPKDSEVPPAEQEKREEASPDEEEQPEAVATEEETKEEAVKEEEPDQNEAATKSETKEDDAAPEEESTKEEEPTKEAEAPKEEATKEEEPTQEDEPTKEDEAPKDEAKEEEDAEAAPEEKKADPVEEDPKDEEPQAADPESPKSQAALALQNVARSRQAKEEVEMTRSQSPLRAKPGDANYEA